MLAEETECFDQFQLKFIGDSSNKSLFLVTMFLAELYPIQMLWIKKCIASFVNYTNKPKLQKQ